MLEANHLKGLLCVGAANIFSTEVMHIYYMCVLCFLSCFKVCNKPHCMAHEQVTSQAMLCKPSPLPLSTSSRDIFLLPLHSLRVQTSNG